MSQPPAIPTGQNEPEGYEILVRGHLDPRWAERLGVPDLISHDDGTTVLAGIPADQAVLHGLLRRIRDLGLTLVSVTRVGLDETIIPNPSLSPRNSK